MRGIEAIRTSVSDFDNFLDLTIDFILYQIDRRGRVGGEVIPRIQRLRRLSGGWQAMEQTSNEMRISEMVWVHDGLRRRGLRSRPMWKLMNDG